MSLYGVIGYHVTLSEGHMIANHPISKGHMIANHPIYGHNYSYHKRGDRSPLIWKVWSTVNEQSG